jgi:hypothetical protein
MLTTLEFSFGSGHAGARLDVSRERPPSAGRRLGVVTLLLVMPILLLIVGQAVGSITGWYSLDHVMNSAGAPWVTILAVATLSALVALGILLAARLRLAASHVDSSWRLAVTLRLTAVETLALGIAAGLLALFVVHLLADGFACARGVTSAC